MFTCRANPAILPMALHENILGVITVCVVDVSSSDGGGSGGGGGGCGGGIGSNDNNKFVFHKAKEFYFTRWDIA
jgi:hypothetical protein